MRNDFSAPQRPAFLHKSQHWRPRLHVKKAGAMKSHKATDEEIYVQELHHVVVVQKPFLQKMSAYLNHGERRHLAERLLEIPI